MNPSLNGNKVEKTFLSSPCSTRTRIIFIIQLISLVSLLLIFVGCLNFSLTIGYYDANDADRDRNIRLRGLEISHRPPVDIQIYHHNIDFPPATNNDSTSENTSNSSATVAPQKLSSIQNSTYNLNPRYLEYLKNRLPPFPKKLHILFPHKEYYRAVHPPLPFVQNSGLRFMERNPNWNVTVHDDRDVDSLIDKAARDDIISWEERNILVGNGSDSFPGAHREFSLLNHSFCLVQHRVFLNDIAFRSYHLILQTSHYFISISNKKTWKEEISLACSYCGTKAECTSTSTLSSTEISTKSLLPASKCAYLFSARKISPRA